MSSSDSDLASGLVKEDAVEAAAHLLVAENDLPGLFGFPSFDHALNHSGLVDLSTHSADDGHHEDHHNRLFFSSFFNPSTLTTCNFTSQAGRSCLGCNTALNCLSSNVGIVRNCRGFFRFCNNGACSFFPGTACSTNSTNSTG